MESATQTAASAVFFTRDLLHHIVLFLDEDQKRVLEAVHSRAAEAVSHHLYGDISWVTHVVAMNRASVSRLVVLLSADVALKTDLLP